MSITVISALSFSEFFYVSLFKSIGRVEENGVYLKIFYLVLCRTGAGGKWEFRAPNHCANTTDVHVYSSSVNSVYQTNNQLYIIKINGQREILEEC